MAEVIKFDTDVPGWLSGVVLQYQLMADNAYIAKKALFDTHAAEWKAAVEKSISSGGSIPDPPTIPTKEIFGVKNGAMTSYFWQDPSVKLPTIGVASGDPGTPVGTTNTGGNSDYALLQKISSDLDAIKSVLGIALRGPVANVAVWGTKKRPSNKKPTKK